jgi:hypothetical protein
MNYDDLHTMEAADDLIDTGVAYLRLKTSIEKSLLRLKALYSDKDIDALTRSDILQVILILRESLE